MLGIKFIFVISLICISLTESRHNYNDYLLLSHRKESDRSSEENFEKLKDLKELQFFEHSIQNHRLEKSENRRNYIKYYAKNPLDNENLSDKSSSSDSSEDSEDNFQLNKFKKYFKKDNAKSTSSSGSSSEQYKSDESDKSDENSRQYSREREWDSQERDESAFDDSSDSSKSESHYKRNKKSSNRKHKNKSKYDSIETIENISKDSDSESSDESYKHVHKTIQNNIKSYQRKISENKSASSESISTDDSSESNSSNSSEDITSEEVLGNFNKIRSTKEIDTQKDKNLNDIVNSREFENIKEAQGNSRNYELSSMYHDFGKISVQQENRKIRNLLGELNKILESERSINTKTVHDNEIHKILKESIINKWKEMDIAVRLILIDNYRSIKNNLLTEVNNNPRATNRDIARLERKLLLLFHMTKKDIVKTVKLTKHKFRIETAKLNLSQQQVYETEQLFLSKLKEQIDAKITALKKNVAFDIEQFHQAVKPIGDYTTQTIITEQTSTEIPFDPVFEMTTIQNNDAGHPGTNTPGTNIPGHVDIEGIPTPTLIEVDSISNSTTTENGVGSHKMAGNDQTLKSSRHYEHSDKSANNISTKVTNYSHIPSTKSIAVTMENPSDQRTAKSIIYPIIGKDPIIESVSTPQASSTSKTTSVSSTNQQNIEQNNLIGTNQHDQQILETAISNAHPTVETSTIISAPNKQIADSEGTLVTSATRQYNLTASNEHERNVSETTTEIISLATKIFNNSTTSNLSSTAIADTETIGKLNTNETSNKRTEKKANSTSVSADPFTDTLLTSPNSEVTPSVIDTTKQSIEQNNAIISNQLEHKISETSIATTHSTLELSTSTSFSGTMIASTQEINSVTTKRTNDQSFTQATTSSTINDKSSTGRLNTTKSNSTPVITSSIEQNNISTDNHAEQKESELTSIDLSSAITNTEQTNSIFTNNSLEQRTTETTKNLTLNNNLSTSTSTTQTNSEAILSDISTKEQNNVTTDNQTEQSVLETTTSTNPQSTTIANTVRNNLVTMNNSSDQRTTGITTSIFLNENPSNEQNNETDQNISESVTPITGTSSTSTSNDLSPALTNTEQINLVTSNNSSGQRTTEISRDPIFKENLSTSALSSTQTNSGAINSIIDTTEPNNVTIDNQKNTETTVSPIISENISISTTHTNPTTTTPTSTTEQDDVTAVNQSKQKELETDHSFSTIADTEQNNLVITNNAYEQRTIEYTTGSTTSENPSNTSLSITEIISNATPLVSNINEQDNVITVNHTKQKVSEITTPITETSATLSSINLSSVITNTDQINLVTTTDSSDQRSIEITANSIVSSNVSTDTFPTTHRTTETTADSVINEISTEASSTTQKASNSELIPSVSSTSKQSEIETTSSDTEKPKQSSPTTTVLSTESIPNIANELENTSQYPETISTMAAATNEKSQSTDTLQNINECIDDSGLVVDCESIINSATTISTNQIAQTWPGVPPECLSLFLTPNGEVASSVTTENHTISDPETLDLCLIIAKTIVQLNNRTTKSSTA